MIGARGRSARYRTKNLPASARETANSMPNASRRGVDETPRPPTVAAAVAARDAGLHYVSDSAPGTRRVRAGKGFRYLTSRGRRIHDPAELSRIRSLAIPPAWSDRWLC